MFPIHPSLRPAYRVRAVLVAAVAITQIAMAPAPPQGPPTTVSPEQVAAATTVQVLVMTVGQGDEIWEKFGHNAIWLRDPTTGLDVAYNWGIFDSFDPDFYGRLIEGEMLYRMEAFSGAGLVDYYIRSNRTVQAQELDLTAAEKAELKAFLEWNDRDENRNYFYDYYLDNCSTRVRDALDRVLGGPIRAQLETLPTGTTFRWHTSRLTAAEVPAWTGLLLALGQPIDQPISAWEASFLPVQFMNYLRDITITGEDGMAGPLVLAEHVLFEADRAPERDAPPSRTAAYTAAGLILGGLLMALARIAATRRSAAIGFFTIAITWTLAAAIFGTLIGGIWAFTGHDAAYANENVLQLNALSFVLLPMLIAFAMRRAPRMTTVTAGAIAALSVLGFVLQALPAWFQVNGPIIGLAMPVHAGLAFGIVRIRRNRSDSGTPGVVFEEDRGSASD